ncbi:MAG TPA: DUF418 domain-containing protein [Kiritimatiellia bacterium]|nr:DUF418 domain-containing protein [Kiritimatiellia bacterium]
MELGKGPVAPRERIVDLDVLRGIALFGILVVNLGLFSSPMFQYALPPKAWPDGLNSGAQFLIWTLFEGKFITLFSLLFGLGFALFAERLEARGERVGLIFARRLAFLLMLGILHAVFFWAGDILAFYAVIGFALLFFFRRQEKTLTRWIIGLFALLVIIQLGFYALIQSGLNHPEVAEETRNALTAESDRYREWLAAGYDIYLHGSFSERLNYRLEEWTFGWVAMLFYTGGVPYILALFLFGLILGRRGLLRNPQQFRTFFIRKRYSRLAIGWIGAIFYAYAYRHMDPVGYNLWTLSQGVVFLFTTPLMTMGYIGLILHGLTIETIARRLALFAPVGRLALTNYLGQTLICTSLFYGYGLGWYGSLTPIATIPLALTIFAGQVAFSRWYLSRYASGPLESLWRRFTYRTSPKINRD